MATNAELAERLYRRFKGVPNFDEYEAQELINDAMQEHDLALTADIPADKQRLLILYAQSEGAWQIALSAAHYFKFTDGEESVDKTMIAENYRKLAQDLRAEYNAVKYRSGGSAFRVATRLDRPYTTPTRRRYR